MKLRPLDSCVIRSLQGLYIYISCTFLIIILEHIIVTNAAKLLPPSIQIIREFYYQTKDAFNSTDYPKNTIIDSQAILFTQFVYLLSTSMMVVFKIFYSSIDPLGMHSICI